MSSPLVLVLCVALSTAFRPLTPTEPPANWLTRSQPGPSGWQLTVAGAGSGPVRDGIGDRGDTGMSGSDSGVPVPPGGEPVPVRLAVDGVALGPVSREQPEAQPVAAGPAKVDGKFPKLDVGRRRSPPLLVLEAERHASVPTPPRPGACR